MITGFVRIEGRPMGLIANDPRHLGGAIDCDGAEKAARFLQLCDAFDLPVLSLCDTPGFMVGPDSEAAGAVRRVSRMFIAGAKLGVPLFTIVLRKGYGLGAQAMAGGGFHAPVFIASWPTGEFGGMGLEGAVRLGYSKELAAETDPEKNKALFEQLVGRLYAAGKATSMAAALEIDAVIDPAETRRWVVRGLDSCPARTKPARRWVDAW
jgi:acetyl-CoA carboxylase carboxyltransferase component